VYDNSNNVAGVTNAIGELTTETSYSGGNAYTTQQKGFNVFGDSLGETVTLPSAEGALAGSYTLSHVYSATTGLVLRDSYPASPGGGALPAETVTHGYETGLDLPAGMGSNLAAYVQNITYSALSQIAQEKIGSTTNNAYITNTYDPHTGSLTDSQTANTAVSTTPFDDTSYTYNPAGDITSQTGVRNGSQSETQCFNYDTLNRLTQAWTATDNCAANPSSNGGSTVGDGISGGAYWTSWQFDPLGDWTSQTQHPLTGGTNTVTGYTYNGNGAGQPNTLTSTSTTGPSGTSTAAYTYDAAGNTLTRNLPAGNQTLTWTHDGKLATDTTSSGTSSYVYDPDGNLLLQKDPGKVTFYPFGGAEQLVLNTSTQAVTGTRFLSLPDGEMVVRTGAGSAYSFEITDQHGTSALTLDSTAANPSWRQFTPYGAPRGQAPPSWPDTNGFLGKPTDANTALTIIGARQYDPASGRFLSPDPVLDSTTPQQFNGYTYAGDNPVSQADPSGLMLPGGDQCGIIASHPCNGGGGGGGGGHTSQICYYCRYAPPQYYGSGGSSAPSDPYYYTPTAPPYYGPAGDVHTPLFMYPVTHPAAAHAKTTQSSAGTYNANLCGRIGGSYCDGAQQAIAKIRTGPPPSWLVTGLLVVGGVGLTFVNAFQGGLDPATDGLEAADIGALTGEVAGGSEDAGAGAAERAAASCGESFTAGTKVLLASGAAVPISRLKRGDKVLATNTRTGKTTAKRVGAVLVHHDTNRYNLKVKTAHGIAVIHTTRNHLFWDPAAGRWAKAASLRHDTRLREPGGRTAIVVSGRDAKARSGWMWDLTVANDHDFYITAAATAVLVHNCPTNPWEDARAQRARSLASHEAGQNAEDAIAARYPGSQTHVTINTSAGNRIVDVLTRDGTAIESKVGYRSLGDSGIKGQIAKDQLLMDDPRVNSVKWVFSPNQYGKAGPSAPLAQALEDAGIEWEVIP
jgi:RHS repeat-associated protein